jgi:hypothetical protein
MVTPKGENYIGFPFPPFSLEIKKEQIQKKKKKKKKKRIICFEWELMAKIEMKKKKSRLNSN